MLSVSSDYKTALTQPKTIDAKIIIGANTITSDDLNQLKRSFNCGLFKTVAKMVEIDSNTSIAKGTTIEPQFGVYLDNAFEYASLGTYKTKDDPILKKDTNSYQMVAYDKIIESMVPYELTENDITYPCTVRALMVAIFTKLSWSTTGIPNSFVNSSSLIETDVYSSLDMTYRDVLDELCTISCNFLLDINGVPTLIDKNFLSTLTSKSGTSISITDAQNEQIEDFNLKGDTTQSDTPTPTSPVPINVVTGEQSITITNGTDTNTYSINLGSIELCKIGTYQDKIYKDNGKWYLHKEIGKYVYNNDLTNNGSSSDSVNFLTPALNVDGNIADNIFANMSCSNLVPSQITNNTGLYGTTGTNKIRINVSTTYGNTHNAIKAIFASKNLTIYYVLKTPTNTEITDSELLEQLENVESARTIKGINNITTTSSNLSSPVTLKYVSAVETIDENYMNDTNVEIKDYVFFNSLVFSRSADSDNIYRQDETSVTNNGLHEFKVRDLQILSLDWRDNFLDEMWNYIKDFSYYAYDINTVGITFLEPIDEYYLSTFGDTYKTLMLNSDLTIQDGVNEKIYANIPEETTTEYKYATTTDKLVNKATLIVDKQNGQIQGLVKTVNNNYLEITDKFNNYVPTSEYVTLENEVTTLQTSTYTKTEINTKLTDGSVTKVQTTSGTFDENGMRYEKTNAKTSTLINEKGVEVDNATTQSELFFAGYDENINQTIVRTDNINVRNFLTIGNNTRIQDYENGGGMFIL